MFFKPSYLKQSFLFFIGICMISGCAMHQGYMVNSAALSSNSSFIVNPFTMYSRSLAVAHYRNFVP
jgi:hypothetical protein